METAILIPAFNPDKRLLYLLDDLLNAGLGNIVVVNDGSRDEYSAFFSAISEKKAVHLLSHPFNMGKGAALKTGLLYIYSNLPSCTAVITADADGQHIPEDIIHLAQTTADRPQTLLLGARTFNKKIPFRSLFGNKLTAFFMRLFLGMKISDTQTGLRAIPRDFIPELIRIPYNRYEFELEMLLAAKRSKRQIAEIPVSTIYLDNNSSSHFNPLLDSFKIYAVLFRYILVSLLTALVDYLVYVPVLYILNHYSALNPLTITAVAVAAGRIAGAAVQYSLVRKVVFYSNVSMINTLPKYIFLVLCSGCASYLIMHAIENSANWNFYLAKLAAELVIYLANFLIQRDLIFQRSEK